MSKEKKFPQEYVVLNTEAPIPYYYDKRDPPVTNPEDPNYSSLRDPTRFADNFDLNKIPVFPREGPNKDAHVDYVSIFLSDSEICDSSLSSTSSKSKKRPRKEDEPQKEYRRFVKCSSKEELEYRKHNPCLFQTGELMELYLFPADGSPPLYYKQIRNTNRFEYVRGSTGSVTSGYAGFSIKRNGLKHRIVLYHRAVAFLFGVPNQSANVRAEIWNLDIDHINQNKLDWSAKNLRFLSPLENKLSEFQPKFYFAYPRQQKDEEERKEIEENFSSPELGDEGIEWEGDLEACLIFFSRMGEPKFFEEEILKPFFKKGIVPKDLISRCQKEFESLRKAEKISKEVYENFFRICYGALEGEEDIVGKENVSESEKEDSEHWTGVGAEEEGEGTEGNDCIVGEENASESEKEDSERAGVDVEEKGKEKEEVDNGPHPFFVVLEARQEEAKKRNEDNEDWTKEEEDKEHPFEKQRIREYFAEKKEELKRWEQCIYSFYNNPYCSDAKNDLHMCTAACYRSDFQRGVTIGTCVNPTKLCHGFAEFSQHEDLAGLCHYCKRAKSAKLSKKKREK